MQGLTQGRIVHYVLRPEDVEGAPAARGGEIRPALVVRVNGGGDGSVNLAVFLDGPNDRQSFMGSETGLLWVPSVSFDPEVPKAGTWHWPPRA